jgi:hypothetical protein
LLVACVLLSSRSAFRELRALCWFVATMLFGKRQRIAIRSRWWRRSRFWLVFDVA